MCVYRINCSGELTYVNETLQRKMQKELPQLLGRTAYDFYPNELAEKYRLNDQEVIEKKQQFHWIEENVDAATGVTHYVEVYKTPLHDSNNHVIGIQGVFWDVSERHRVEQEHEKNEALLKAIAEQSPDFVMLLDQNLRIVYINNTLAGINKASIIGKSLPNLAQSDQSIITRKLKSTLRTGKMSCYESKYCSPAGQTFFFETRAVRIQNGPMNSQLHITASDITNRIESEQQLRQAATVFTNAKEAIIITDANGSIININQAFNDITGFNSNDAIGLHFSIYLAAENPKNTISAITAAVATNGYWNGELNITSKVASELFAMVAISTVRDNRNEIQSYVILMSDITRQKEHQRELEHIAHYDSLTQLPNRYLLNSRLRNAMSNASKCGDGLAVLYLDLDGFKAVNDRHGHSVGDKLLVNIAKRLLETLDPRDTVARLGGDEFVMVIPNIGDREKIEGYYNQILSAIAQPIHSNVGVIELSASLGITYYPQSESVDPDHLIRQADIAMYQAKVHGKNRYTEFDLKKDKHQRSFGQILSELKLAISTDQLELFFQPKVNMRIGTILGVEVLVRWQHPHRGLLTPDEFLPVTIGDPIAVELDNWVLCHALYQFSKWQNAHPNMEISINVCIQSLESPNFTDNLADLVAGLGIKRTENIYLEILESSAVQDVNQVSEVIRECEALGVKFSLDDFGTGFSTLNFLKKLPASELKIDRSFVRDMLVDDDDLAIIRGILGLASAFKKTVVAEGVETEQHGLALLNLGCENAQGYAIAKPMRADQLLEWQKTWAPSSSWLDSKNKSVH